MSGPRIKPTTSVQQPGHFTTRVPRRTKFQLGYWPDVLHSQNLPSSCKLQPLSLILHCTGHGPESVSVNLSYLSIAVNQISSIEIVNCIHLSRIHQSVSSIRCPACNQLRNRISAPAPAWALSPDQRFQRSECHKASVMIAIKSSMLFALTFLFIQVSHSINVLH